MKRLFAGFILVVIILSKFAGSSYAQFPTPPIICGCPEALNSNIYQNSSREDGGGQCASDLVSFQQDPARNHLWVEDPEVTEQGKADERSRQFLFWVFKTGTIDYHPTLIKVWGLTRNVTFFLLLLVAAMMGIGMIVGQRAQFTTGIKIWPQIVKLFVLLLYVSISSTLVIGLIQLSDVLMKFFIETLGGRDLLNINFGVVSGEENYIRFVGCRDLNIRVQEAAKTELLMLRITNATYYIMGIMMILRKVVLWFLLFVSPFLALLLPFMFIKNVGWIWIGVFFQWLFYGPLFALFLGGLTTIWRTGIPFIFDFSRVSTEPASCNPAGYIYPTAINILYGGPAQKLAICSNANYVDTFAEYIISLVMLGAVIFFPWWLLRIFRDYCCEGIAASKNILMSMYDTMRGGPPALGPSPVPVPSGLTTGTALKIPKEELRPEKVRLETVEEIRKIKTQDITRNMQFNVSKLTDIARFETNKQNQETITKNINFLQNPMKAETPTERQKFMNIRSELFSRAVKEDKSAKQILSSLSTSKVEQIQKREEFIKTMPQQIPMTHVVSVKVKIPTAKIQSVTSSFVQSVSQNSSMVQSISQSTQIPQTQIKSVLNSFSQNISQPTNKIVQNISSQTGIAKEKVSSIIQNTTNVIRQSQLIDKIAVKEQVTVDKVEKIISSIPSTISKEKETLSKEKQTVVKEESFIKELSTQIGIPFEKVSTVTKSLLTNVASDKTFVKQLEKQTNLQTVQVGKILNTFVQNIDQPLSTSINNISSQTGIEKDKVREVITTTVNNLQSSRDTVKQIVAKENIQEKDLTKIVETHIPVVTEPEKHIESTISIPPSISLDEYEQVKKMWINQYERGEVPVSEKIKSRTDWVSQDVVFITNTLNKLVSESPETKQQGLDDLGYILPIFLINNLKGEQLMVYLKAKLEAAKDVETLQQKEAEFKEDVEKKEEEELVEVEAPKTEEKEKVMEMKQELEEEKETEEKNVEEETQVEEEKKSDEQTDSNEEQKQELTQDQVDKSASEDNSKT